MRRHPELWAQLEKLRPQDLVVVRLSIEMPGASEINIASVMNISVDNVRKRLQRAYDVLGVEPSRISLYAAFHPAFVICCCVPT